jgi:PPM family protein phosphatase
MSDEPQINREIVAQSDLEMGWASAAHPGKRKATQEDAVGQLTPARGTRSAEEGNSGFLFVLADGVGGGVRGAEASHIAVETILAEYSKRIGKSRNTDDVVDVLKQAVALANRKIYDASGGSEMESTCVCVAIRSTVAVVVWAGDSRAYCLHNNVLEQWTTDHSWLEDYAREAVRTGEMTLEQLESEKDEHKHQITRALGMEANIEPSVVTQPIYPGDLLLLCSDGLYGMVPDHIIVDQLGRTALTLEQRASALVVQANGRGGIDNISLYLVDVARVLAALDGSAGRSVNLAELEDTEPLRTSGSRDKARLPGANNLTSVAYSSPPPIPSDTTSAASDGSTVAISSATASSAASAAGYGTGDIRNSAAGPAGPAGPATGSDNSGANAGSADLAGVLYPNRVVDGLGPASTTGASTTGYSIGDANRLMSGTTADARDPATAGPQGSGVRGVSGGTAGGAVDAGGTDAALTDSAPQHIPPTTGLPSLTDYLTEPEPSAPPVSSAPSTSYAPSIHDSPPYWPDVARTVAPTNGPGSSAANRTEGPPKPSGPRSRPGGDSARLLPRLGTDGAPPTILKVDSETPQSAARSVPGLPGRTVDVPGPRSQAIPPVIVGTAVGILLVLAVFSVLLLLRWGTLFGVAPAPRASATPITSTVVTSTVAASQVPSTASAPPVMAQLITNTPTLPKGSTATEISAVLTTETPRVATSTSTTGPGPGETITASPTSPGSPESSLTAAAGGDTPTVTSVTLVVDSPTPTVPSQQPTVNPQVAGWFAPGDRPSVWAECEQQPACAGQTVPGPDGKSTFLNKVDVVDDFPIYGLFNLYWRTNMVSEEDFYTYWAGQAGGDMTTYKSRGQQFARGMAADTKPLLGQPISQVVSYTQLLLLAQVDITEGNTLLSGYMQSKGHKLTDLYVQFFERGVVVCSSNTPAASVATWGDCDLLKAGTLYQRLRPNKACGAGSSCAPWLSQNQEELYSMIMGAHTFQGGQNVYYERLAFHIDQAGSPRLTALGKLLEDALLGK